MSTKGICYSHSTASVFYVGSNKIDFQSGLINQFCVCVNESKIDQKWNHVWLVPFRFGYDIRQMLYIYAI